MSARMKRAEAAWGEHVPSFVKSLVKASDETSQNVVARQIGYSAPVISQVINKTYPGDLEAVADRVRVKLDGSVVTCPALGEIKEIDCEAWRNRRTALRSAVPLHVRMFRTCRNCPLFPMEAET